MPNTYYATKISPHRGKTDEGYLICSKVPVARIGYQFYLDKELGFEPSEKIKKENNGYNVYRPEEEVFSEETLSSFEGKPITDDHPQEQVTSDNFQIYSKGNIKNVHRGDGEYKDYILADLVIWDKELVNKIENGKQAVSVGYSCDYEEHGRELWQKDIICNHIAIVDEGRAGEKAIIRDNLPKNKEEAKMPEEVKKEEKEEKKEEVVEKDKCKDEASEEEEKKEAKDSVDLAEVIQNIASRVDALEAKFEAKFGDKEKTGFDELEEEIFKEKKEEADEEAPEKIIEKEKEVVGDSVLLDFVRQVKPLVAQVKDKKQSKLLEDSMCKIIRGTLMNDSKKKPEKEEKSVYSNFISKDTTIKEENPYDILFNKFKGEK